MKMQKLLLAYDMAFKSDAPKARKAELCCAVFERLKAEGVSPCVAKAELEKIDGGQFSSALVVPEEKKPEPVEEIFPTETFSEEDDSDDEGKSQSKTSEAVKKIWKDSVKSLEGSPILNIAKRNIMLVAIAGVLVGSLLIWSLSQDIFWAIGWVSSFVDPRVLKVAVYLGILYGFSWVFKYLSEKFEAMGEKTLSKFLERVISACYLLMLAIIFGSGFYLFNNWTSKQSSNAEKQQTVITKTTVNPESKIEQKAPESDNLPPIVVTPAVVMPKAWPTIAGQECRDESLLFAIGDYSASGIMVYKISCYKLGKFVGTRQEYWQIVDWAKAQPTIPNWKETRKLQEQIISEWGYSIEGNGYIKGSDDWGQKVANEATTFFSSRN